MRLLFMPSAILFLLASTGCASDSNTTTAVREAEAPLIANAAASYARQMVGKHYRYGGNDPSRGFDCSGLVQYSYRRAGLRVARNTALQRAASERISLSEVRKGDLLFFDQLGKKASHVAIYVGNGRFVHAPSSGKKVRVDALSNPYWKRYFAGARRFAGL